MQASADLYEVLSIHRTATKAEIKKAYHKAALNSHPDKVPEAQRGEAEVKFKAVSQAYEILHDDEARERYDQFGMSAFDKGTTMDTDDLLNQMFSGGMGGMGGMPGMSGRAHGSGRSDRFQRKPRGKDVVQNYEISLEDLYKGRTVKLASTRNKLCTICTGSGGKDKAKSKKCSNCDGKGWKQILRMVGLGLAAQERVPCGNCRGSGEVFREKDRCKKCKGQGVEEEMKILEIYVPRGSKSDDKIVLEGEADEQPGYETGDIVFVLEEKVHDVFTRTGTDLKAIVLIDLIENLTGFSRVVLKHLDGRGIHLTHKPGQVLRPGEVLKIVGEGMPYKKSDGKGDLYLVIKIEFPEDGWTPNIEGLKKVLPPPSQPEIIADPVDELDYARGSSLEDYGDEEAGWEDEDGDEGTQCAQQ